ncbi:MAG TPA: 23S rRNA (adenine(1618)-N(6))-methyltransferase RlmF [Methylophilaceae bacterium]|nr:23S rRNA (adenine(1618)-N(6))-methyltransferase RlmF [Methylophilaceae bacterium]
MNQQNNSIEKTGLHPRNKHRERYDFEKLICSSPQLARFVRPNAYNDISIDFANVQAVKALNQALLQKFYAITGWDIPPNYLCPPIPGRADYLHYIADLLGANNQGVIPRGKQVSVLDIGAGANAIYPLIGQREYGWRFVGADIDAVGLANAQSILDANDGLSDSIELRLQTLCAAIFDGIIREDETFDLTMCNPPFHASLDEANAGTSRKLQGLSKSRGESVRKNKDKASSQNAAPALNFGGQSAELYCEGGEEAFISKMITESVQFASRCLWFTTLVSKATSLPGVYRTLKKAHALQVKTIDMAQGQKKSRIVAWTFLSPHQHTAWRNSHWQNT